MQQLKVSHLTEYTFANYVTLEPHRLLIRPREGHDIRIVSSRLDISPAYTIRWHRDVYDNSVATVSFLEAASHLSIFSEITLEHYDDAPLDFVVADYAVNYPFQYQEREKADLAPYQQANYPAEQALINSWLEQTGLGQGAQETYVLLDRLNKWISQNFNYMVREEAGVQTPAETLNSGSGSCRDYAALFMETCRMLGLACRFVSGYLHAPSTEAGSGSTHAWAEIYLPGPGWKGFDPTSGNLTSRQHIPVAVARHPEWVPPVAGSFVGSAQVPTLKVNVQVNAL
ncbi:MAG TPA: transglutaminase family protein [Gammaproteobacteria bacterium]|nr:transglutaminase family protein [Gammaproteobacteria bacterium]